LDAFLNSFRHANSLAGIADVIEQNCKFVATQPREYAGLLRLTGHPSGLGRTQHGVIPSDRTGQPGSNLHKKPITGEVAQAVIHDFEAVHVHR
jgi:hypothetical protein